MSLLVIDIGNSNVSISVFIQKEKKWLPIKTLSTQHILSKNISTQNIRNVLSYNFLDISCVAISSVVPELNTYIETETKKLYSCPLHNIHTTMLSPLQKPIPSELGSDLFANAVAAYNKSKGKASITVDFGTALSFIATQSSGSIAGVIIAPGVNISLQALVKNTSLLQDITLQYPSSTLGKTTEHALQSGIILGNEQLVIGLCKRIKAELQEPCCCYATGGNTKLFPPLTQYFDEIDMYHTMKGIAHIATNNLSHI